MSSNRTPGSDYLKYSGLAFQMFFILLIGWFGGSYIDGYLELEKPVFALSLMFIFLIGYFYKLIKDLSPPKKPK